MADAEMNPIPPAGSDLPVRTATAIIMLAVLGFAFWHGGWVLDVLILLVGAATFWEWQRLVRKWQSEAKGRALWVVIGAIYIGGVTALLMAVHSVIVALIVGVTVATDTGAYLIGRKFGNRKIAPRISPSKTWAGLYGGMAGAALFMGAVGWFAASAAQAMAKTETAYGFLPMIAGAAAIGLPLAVAAQAGDFFESWLKRRAGVKDSSRWLPGHGGIFDRVDGMLPVALIVGMVAVATRDGLV